MRFVSQGATSVFQGLGGVIYVTGNSASGSKYYGLTGPAEPSAPLAQLGGEPGERAQLRQGDGAQEPPLRRENIRSGTCAAPNAAVEVGNVDWCGPDEGASPALPIGSLVDHVVIHPARH